MWEENNTFFGISDVVIKNECGIYGPQVQSLWKLSIYFISRVVVNVSAASFVGTGLGNIYGISSVLQDFILKAGVL